jgi:hypothetical protein
VFTGRKNGRTTQTQGVIAHGKTTHGQDEEKNIPFFRKLFSRAVRPRKECGL